MKSSSDEDDESDVKLLLGESSHLRPNQNPKCKIIFYYLVLFSKIRC